MMFFIHSKVEWNQKMVNLKWKLIQMVSYIMLVAYWVIYISGKPEESDSENEDDPEDEEVIDKIRDRLPDDEEVLNEFLVRSLAIFMLLRNVSLWNFSLRILQFRLDAYVKFVVVKLKQYKDSVFT